MGDLVSSHNAYQSYRFTGHTLFNKVYEYRVMRSTISKKTYVVSLLTKRPYSKQC